MKRLLLLFVFIVLGARMMAQVWKPVYLPTGHSYLLAGQAQGSLYVSDYYSGTFRSADGENFMVTAAVPGTALSRCTSVVESGTYTFAVFNGSVYRSTDGGSSWSLSFLTDWGNCLYAASDTIYLGSNRLMRSIDAGATWTTLVGASWYPYSSSFFRAIVRHKSRLLCIHEDELISYNLSGGDSLSLASNITCIKTDGQRLFAHINNQFMKSDDDGYSWMPAMSGLSGASPYRFDLNGGKLYLATSDGVYISDSDDILWTPTALNYGGCQWIIKMSDGLFVNCEGKVQRSTDEGATWTPVYKGIYADERRIQGTQTFNIMSQSNQSYRNVSVDGFEEIPSFGCWAMTTLYDKVFTGPSLTSDGMSWTSIEGPEYTSQFIVAHKGRYYMNRLGPDQLWSCDSGAVDTWLNVSIPSNYQIKGIAANDSMLCVAAVDYAANDTMLLVSTDEGLNWTSNYLPRLGQMRIYKNVLFVYGQDGSVFSADGGISWLSAFPGLPDNKIASMEIVHDSLYCVSLLQDSINPFQYSYNVHYWNDVAGEWLNRDYNLFSLISNEVYGNFGMPYLGGDPNRLFLMVPGFGIWQLTDHFPVDVAETLESKEFHLYPNPSAGAFTISGAELRGCDIIIRDIQGRQLRSLRLTAERTDLAHDLNAGIYLVEIRKGKEFVGSRKLVIQ
jgi:hypothetical protein